MKVQTGETYQSGEFAKALMAAEPKVGKTSFEIASALGVLPWQKFGGVVDDPKNLFVVAFDASAVSGIDKFLLNTCGAPKEALNYTIFNMQDDVRKVFANPTDWDFDFFNSVVQVVKTLESKARGVPMVIVSSLTGLAQGLERALGGPAGTKKGAGMDMAKWAAFNQQMSELRNLFQQDRWHCLWEAHIYKPGGASQGREDGEEKKESIQVSGKTGQNFAYNVEQVFRVRRIFNSTFGDTKCDNVYLDTRPALDFITGGRGFTENLDAKEPDMTLAFHKLGLKVGRWGKKKEKK